MSSLMYKKRTEKFVYIHKNPDVQLSRSTKYSQEEKHIS